MGIFTNEKPNIIVVSQRVYDILKTLEHYVPLEDEWLIHFAKSIAISKDELIHSAEPEEYVIQILEKNKEEFYESIEKQKEQIRSLKTFPHPSV